MDSHKKLVNRMDSFSEANTETQEDKVSIKEFSINGTLKDSVFTTLFSTKENLLDLHKTLHPEDTSITVDDIVPVTLENVFVKDIYNDVAYKVGNRIIILVEHQSTINRNMPLRLLIYLAREYERIVFGAADFNRIYRKNLIAIPKPEFYVVYTGKELWEEDTLRLSEAYSEKGEDWLELKVRIIKNDSLVHRSGKLNEYLLFVQKVYEVTKPGISKRTAILAAIDDCIKAGILADFLTKKREEIVSMLEREFKLDEYGAAREEDGKEIGKEIGEMRDKIALVRRALSRGFTDYNIIDLYVVSEEELAEIKRLQEEYPDWTEDELAIKILSVREFA